MTLRSAIRRREFPRVATMARTMFKAARKIDTPPGALLM